MSSKVDWYFRQRVTEAELDLAFDQLEQADWNLASDLGVYGVISGAVAVPHSPVANLSIDLTAPGRAYDRLGRRVFVAAGTNVDCSKDSTSQSTDVPGPGQERWVSIFIRFARLTSDARTDGNNQQLFFRHDESYEVVVRQEVAAPTGNAQRPTLEADELLVCDVLRRYGQNQINASDLDGSRRQAFVFASADSVSVLKSAWKVLAPTNATVQAALDSVDTILDGHLKGTARRHPASDIDVANPGGFLFGGTLQNVLGSLVNMLSSTQAGAPGAKLIGADAIEGSPNGLLASNVDAQLSAILGSLNSHINAGQGHKAASIYAEKHFYIQSYSVQAQLEEIVNKLASHAVGEAGAGWIGTAPQGDANAPFNLTTQSVRDQLGELLTGLNNVAGAVDAEHYRYGANAGLHRAIKQPVLGGPGLVLLWESLGNGQIFSKLRVYLDDNTLWFVMGVSWDGSKWQWDSAGGTAGALCLSSFGIEIRRAAYVQAQNGPPFASWPAHWKLPFDFGLDSSGWVAAEAGATECGRISLEGSNPNNIFSNGLRLGTSVTFRTRFDQAPSNVTLTMLSSGNWGTTNINVTDIDKDGFAVNATVAAPPSNGIVRWVGRYVATR